VLEGGDGGVTLAPVLEGGDGGVTLAPVLEGGDGGVTLAPVLEGGDDALVFGEMSCAPTWSKKYTGIRMRSKIVRINTAVI
jgi:hypothetical protein